MYLHQHVLHTTLKAPPIHEKCILYIYDVLIYKTTHTVHDREDNTYYNAHSTRSSRRWYVITVQYTLHTTLDLSLYACGLKCSHIRMKTNSSHMTSCHKTTLLYRVHADLLMMSEILRTTKTVSAQFNKNWTRCWKISKYRRRVRT